MIEIYTDGSCLRNKKYEGVGSWAYAIVSDGNLNELNFGRVSGTTSNRMELTAVSYALTHLLKLSRSSNEIKLFSDSKYFVDGFNEKLSFWKSNGWRKSNGSPLKNIDLWSLIAARNSRFPSLSVQWTKGHSGNKFNTLVDTVAACSLQGEGPVPG